MEQETEKNTENSTENAVDEKKDRARLRKERRRKERMQATALVGGVFLGALLVVSLLIAVIVKAVTSVNKNKDKEKADAQAVTEAPADPGTEEEKEPEEITQEQPEDTSQEEQAEDVQAAEETKEPESQPEADEGDDETGKDTSEETGNSAVPTVAGIKELSADTEKMIEEEISGLSIEQKVAKLFIVTPGQLVGRETEPKNVGGDFSEKITAYPVSGIVLKTANFSSEDELTSMISNIRLMSPGRVLILVEDNGGENSPFVLSGMSENVISSESEIGASLGNSGAYSAGISIGSELRHFGIDMTIAPYIDVSTMASSYAASKGFGKDMETTTELSKNMIRGLEDQNVLCAVRSFPGYGDVTSDGSNGQIVSAYSKDDLVNMKDLYMGAVSVGADAMLVSHVGLPKVRGDQRPASISGEVINDVIREEWGYDGVVMTDYMDKSCIYQKYTYAEAAEGVIEAGADIVLSAKNFEKSYNGILEAVKRGKISEERIDESLKRIYRLFYLTASE